MKHDARRRVTPWNYTNHTCKCDRCRLAWNEYQRKRRAQRRQDIRP